MAACAPRPTKKTPKKKPAAKKKSSKPEKGTGKGPKPAKGAKDKKDVKKGTDSKKKKDTKKKACGPGNTGSSANAKRTAQTLLSGPMTGASRSAHAPRTIHTQARRLPGMPLKEPAAAVVRNSLDVGANPLWPGTTGNPPMLRRPTVPSAGTALRRSLMAGRGSA